MCTINCSKEEFDVIVDSLHSFMLASERCLYFSSKENDTFMESLWRKRYEMCQDLLFKLTDDLPF